MVQSSSKSRVVLLAGVAAFFTASGALAADIVDPTAYDWTGPYVCLQGGYAWGDNETDIDFDPRLVVLRSVDSIDIDSWLGGIHPGYLLQSDSLVFGIEGDGEFADIDGDVDIQAGGQSRRHPTQASDASLMRHGAELFLVNQKRAPRHG